MKLKTKYFVLLMLLVTLSIITIVKLKHNKQETKLDNVSLNEIDEYSGIALMLEQAVGEYAKSDSNEWPRKGYKLNQRLSGCVDESGNTIEKALTYEYGTLKVKTRVNASCYLYFDKRKAATEELIATVPEEQLWDSTLEDDGYRYVGTNPDNYICFGTDSISECTSDTDKYMYRIIGIFEDSEGQQHLKLIKKEALNTTYAWHNDNTVDVDWDESDLYKGINGSYFVTNQNYSYMQDSMWTDKIEIWSYTSTNTLSNENYYTNGVYGPNYYYQSILSIYLHETNQSGKTSQICYHDENTLADCSVGEWKEVNSKVGLMYASDYALSLGKSSINLDSYDDRNILKTGWMHISNNDVNSLLNEWSMSNRGLRNTDTYSAWNISSLGNIYSPFINETYSVRPVFYLDTYVELKEGLGTIKEPYIINNDTAVEEIIGTSGSDLWESTLEDDGYRYVGTNPDNYICFGTTDQEECTSDTDKYMYRIIGIFEDEEGKQHLKLIKKEALNTAYAWHSDSTVDIDWEDSDLYKGINGEHFATNTDYSYMQDSTWINKISEWNYTSTNTKTYESSGPNYYNSVRVKNIYLHEMNRSMKTSTIGEWKDVYSKIGLMYVSDYLLSLGSIALEYNSYDNREMLKTGWIHINNNDTGLPSDYEWTISRASKTNSGVYTVWNINSNGSVDSDSVSRTSGLIRPVFYLTSDTQLSKGTGTSTDPYTIKPAKPTDTERLIENVNSDVLWESTLEDDGYRYVGTNPNNYVCFGYDNVENNCDFTSSTNTDLYAYRIIGIFNDKYGVQHLKLIKKEALNSTYAWHSDSSVDIDWDVSDLYKGLNESYFLTNTGYSYMQNIWWTNKISKWEYTVTNKKTLENYNDNGVYGPYYRYTSVKAAYLHELNRSSKINQICYHTASLLANCNVGDWKTITGKIGLMYVSDYQLSLGSTALDYINNDDYISLKTGWMHLSNADVNAPNTSEWTMTRYGFLDVGKYGAIHVHEVGRLRAPNVDEKYSVRPVFYLTSDIKIGGEGTTGSPYIIS